MGLGETDITLFFIYIELISMFYCNLVMAGNTHLEKRFSLKSDFNILIKPLKKLHFECSR